MQHKELKIVYKELALDELNAVQKNLIKLAIAATQQAYAPYSEFYVGCALQMGTGEVLSGSNQENAAYPQVFVLNELLYIMQGIPIQMELL